MTIIKRRNRKQLENKGMNVKGRRNENDSTEDTGKA
jgi:hypothetical protein